MSNCKPVLTPVDLNDKLRAVTGPAVDDPSEYRSLAAMLQYLTVTQPDLSYVIQQACLHMHDPRECHLALIKRIL
jgi:hypothetical protein